MYFHGDRNKKEIAITFDDGPAEDTLRVLEVLKKYDIKATFFLVGKMIKDREYIIQQAKNDGHEFGNHTFSHKRLWFKSKKFIENEIKKCDEELEKVDIKTDLFRFPGFKYGPTSLSVCKKLEKKIIFIDSIFFNQNGHDWYRPWLKKIGLIKGAIKIDKVVEHTLRNTKNGSILGLHDYLQEIGPNPEVVSILEKILPELKEKGFKFVMISEMFS